MASMGVALRAGLLRASLPLGLPAGRPRRALRIPNAACGRIRRSMALRATRPARFE